jgi:hypothetical protein
MGIFPYEIVLRDIPFNKKLWAQNEYLKWQRGDMNFSGVKDPAEIVSALSLIPLISFRRGQWPRWNRFGGISDPAQIRLFSEY